MAKRKYPYKTVNYPEQWWLRLQAFLREHPELGYRNPSEFCISITRIEFQKLLKEYKRKKEFGKRD